MEENVRRAVARLRVNSREKLCNIENGYRINNQVKNTIIIKKIAIPDFQRTGFPFMVAYFLETDRMPTDAINDSHTNNCYRISGDDMYFIEAIFLESQEVEDYDEIIKSCSKSFFKHYIVEDLKREGFIP